MTEQADKGRAFRALHRGTAPPRSAFVIPNPWDAGSAVLLAHLGYEALATTSAGYAFSLGLRDNKVGRDAMLEHARQIVAATELPVSADLENGFADAPREVAATIALAADAGLVGGSIEDATGDAAEPIYAFELAVERVRAAAEQARALPFDFVLTARCENHLVGRPDLADTIRRLQAYQDAGADVLYAPGLSRIEDIATLVAAVDRPVNVLAGSSAFTVASLSAIGVRRISVGSAFSRAALGGFMRAAREVRERGSFGFLDEAMPFGEVNGLFPA